jgi:hypothetical protein
MNDDNSCQPCRTCGTIVAIIGTLLVMAILVKIMRHYTETPSLAADRAAERMKILADFKTDNEPLIEKYAWQDQTKGIVRVPIDRAKELVLAEWQNPAVAHSNLMDRAAKAFAPAPKPPPVKNEYE